MIITLDSHQERALRQAISAGQFVSVEEFIGRAIERLAPQEPDLAPARTVLEQGLGLFGSPEDTALLDEVVMLAYEERRHPGKQDPLL